MKIDWKSHLKISIKQVQWKTRSCFRFFWFSNRLSLMHGENIGTCPWELKIRNSRINFTPFSCKLNASDEIHKLASQAVARGSGLHRGKRGGQRTEPDRWIMEREGSWSTSRHWTHFSQLGRHSIIRKLGQGHAHSCKDEDQQYTHTHTHPRKHTHHETFLFASGLWILEARPFYTALCTCVTASTDIPLKPTGPSTAVSRLYVWIDRYNSKKCS